MRIDHAIRATQDRDAAAEHFDRVHGLAAAGGGRHDGIGTHNRIVPLGGGYLELLAVADAEEAAGSPLGRTVVETLASDAGGLAWVEVSGDAGRVREWLGGVGLPVRVQPGEPALLAIGVGERELR